MMSIIDTIITIGVFLLGMVLSVQLIAALYGIIDLWYTLRTVYLKVFGKITLWSGIVAAVFLALGESYRSAFLWGLGALVVFQIGTFLGMKLLTIRNIRLLEDERSEP
ncbi:MAG: hypothetical protein V3S89_06940 [Desulfobacterales bacterium]